MLSASRLWTAFPTSNEQDMSGGARIRLSILAPAGSEYLTRRSLQLISAVATKRCDSAFYSGAKPSGDREIQGCDS